MLSGEGFQRNFLNFFYVRGQTIPAQAVKTDSIALLKRVVKDSDLLTILPMEAVADEIKKGELKTLPCETPAEYARVGFLFRPESLMTPQMQLMIDRIRASIRSRPKVAALRADR
jgi:DNA-binding transcriptional LysR family regulator